MSNAESILDVPGPGFLQKLGRGRRASVVSFVVAVGVHAALIGAGAWYVATTVRFTPARLVLPKGVAAEVDGSDGGVPVRFTQDPPPVDAPPATGKPAELKQLLAPPPAEFEPPETSRPVTVEADQGTSDFGPLPVMSSSSALPPANIGRQPPVQNAGEVTASSGAPAEVTPPLADAASAGGTAADGAGRGNGGGPQGVVDGMPVPSTHNKHPDYPEDARRSGWTGTVQLELDLDENGRVTAVRVVRSCGHEVLDRAAVAAAKTWEFSPATMGGRPVPVTVPIPVNYAIDSR